jgi:aminopeptidase N
MCFMMQASLRRRPPVQPLRLPVVVALGALITLLGASASTVHAVEPTTQLPRNVRPAHYDLTIVPDAQALTFRGEVTIAIDVLQPTASITLNAAELDFESVALTGSGRAADSPPPAVHVDAERQTATFTLPAEILPGRYQLALAYSGTIGTQAAGLFALDYQAADGPRRVLLTQFEAPDARRMLPCWDEPAYKATFDLTAVVPSHQLAVSNMPVARREDLGDGRARVRFATSPKMSTYLLFFGLGDLERSTTTVDGVEVAVVTRKGAVAQAAGALAATAASLHEYNEYFGTPYPLPKLDTIAGPGASQFFGAMENWGAIMTFEHAALFDPAISTQEDRQRVFSIAAHEVSHQWFGNLVTMSWWDDLWLNEGFASWMAGRTTAKLHPEWKTHLEAVDSREAAMMRDSLATTHAVVQHVETVEQMSQAFDRITYAKGRAVIAMLERYVGEEDWRTGVRRYIARHAYGNATTGDLWQEIGTAANKPVTAIAKDFTEQPGVPLIAVGAAVCAGGKSRVPLVQSEFTRDRPDKAPASWRVPVAVAPLDGGEPVHALVTGGKTTVEVPGCGPVIVNAGQLGYFRTLYTPRQLAALAGKFGTVAPIDQLGILADSWALGLIGKQPASDALELAAATPLDADPKVWASVAKMLGSLDEYYRGEGKRQQAFRAVAVDLLGPVLARVGWTARDGEPAPVAVLRNQLIEVLGQLRDPAVVAESRRRYAASATDPTAIPAPLRKTILGVVAAHADAATWDRLHAAARAETTPLIKDRLYLLLAASEDEALARRALELALSSEPRKTTTAQMIVTVADRHPDLAFDFAMANRAAVEQRIDAPSRSRYFPGLGTRSADPAMVGKVRGYASAHLPPTARRDAETAVASVEDRIRVRRERLPEIDAWVAKRQAPLVPELPVVGELRGAAFRSPER